MDIILKFDEIIDNLKNESTRWDAILELKSINDPVIIPNLILKLGFDVRTEISL